MNGDDRVIETFSNTVARLPDRMCCAPVEHLRVAPLWLSGKRRISKYEPMKSPCALGDTIGKELPNMPC